MIQKEHDPLLNSSVQAAGAKLADAVVFLEEYVDPRATPGVLRALADVLEDPATEPQIEEDTIPGRIVGRAISMIYGRYEVTVDLD